MASSTSSNYEYMNEDQIDPELQCGICKQPFESPVSVSVCHHTFCRKCIRRWWKNDNTCPECRTVRKSARPYTDVKTPIVINQLGRLLVRCSLCSQTDIERGNWESHEEKCPKQLVECLSADIKCPWVGSRDVLTSHLETCAFEQVRPVIDDLKQSIHLLEDRMSFLLTVINHGNLMSSKCNKSSKECKHQKTLFKTPRFQCSMCEKSTSRERVSLHSCTGGCICQSCVDKQYSDYEENPDSSDQENNPSSSDDDQ